MTKKTFLRATLCGFVTLLLAGCHVPQNISYFQDAAALNNMAVSGVDQFKLRPEDKINIVVNCQNPMLEQQFTLTTATKGGTVLGAEVAPITSAGGSGNSQVVAYTVDEQGTIDFPILGKIRVAGMTRGEVAAYIKDRLVARELVSDPIVTVEYVNLSVRVMGEVAKPGNISITKDHFTLMDALTHAGDLTINGNRKTVMVNRQADGVNKVYYVDLTNMQQTLLSPAYYLEQNDLVYVSPNDKRMRESRGEGNAFQTPSLWLSIASFLTTLAVLIF